MNDLNTYLNENFSKFKGGTLRMFGDWFGRPHDNFHQAKQFSFDGCILTVTFYEDEQLIVWNPQDVIVERHRFIIGNADRVRWEWYYYGRPKLQENRFFLDYTRTSDGIKVESNVDWYAPVFSASGSEPAVQIE
jgi:hypothetical protein